MTFSRKIFPAVLLVVALGATACSTVRRINPFHGSTPKDAAVEGDRISIVAADQKLEPAEALKGVDFALPAVETVTAWPLPGGTPEQSVEHPNAGNAFTVAWRRGFGRGSNRAFHVTAPPVAADGRIYVMDGAAGVAAFDLADGRQV